MTAAGPEPTLLAAAAMVFVDDLDRPRPDEADLHHLLRVRRLRPGERVVAADGRGGFVPCRIGDAPGPVSAGAVTEVLVVEGPVEHQARPSPGLTVAFAPVKGDRPEWVVQKLTEVGVDRIVVLRTARTVVRWEGERAGRAAARLATVAREAAAQSRRVWLPDVAGPLGLDEVGAELGTELVLARPGGGPPSLEHPAVAVGPEGGWDEAELARFPGSLGLGPTVLRAETAAVVAGALLCGLRSGAVGPPALA